MVVRIFSAFRSISVLALLLVFLFVYANLPEQVGLIADASGRPDYLVSRNSFFFIGLLLFSLTNGAFSWIIKTNKKDQTVFAEWLVAWMYGLSLCFNLFYLVSLIFLNAFNSLEKVNLNNFGITLMGVAILTIIWLLGFLLVLTKRGQSA